MNLVFKVPLKIDYKLSLNRIYAGINWRLRMKEKQAIKVLTFKALGDCKAKFTNPVSIKMSFYSNLDVSNHAYLFKMIEDAIKEKGILQDDSYKFVKENIIQKQNEFKGVIVEIKEFNGY